jgi:hypothetical protein
MKKKVVISAIIIIAIFLIYRNQEKTKYDKTEYVVSKKISENVFLEMYQPYTGGVLDGNIYSYYITDSTAFRKYVGRCDDKEVYRFVLISEDSIKAIKFSWRNRMGDLPEIPIDSLFYSIKSLKKEGEFE